MIGRPVKRLEDRRLLTGAGTYVDDVRIAGMTTAVIIRSPHAHARILGIDSAALADLPGVIGCFTARDLPAGTSPIPVRMGAAPALTPYLQPVLARDEVRYVGEPVAVVVATDAYLARDAAERVRVDYDALPAMVDAGAAARSESRALYEHGDVAQSWVAAFGDVDAAVATARHVLRRRFRIHRHTAVPMETRGLVARHDPASGVLTVWGPTKVQNFNRRLLAGMLGLADDAIHFLEGDVGGGFGVRGEFYPEDFLIPLLAMRTGHPVRWIEERREHFLTINHSRGQEWEVTVAADGTGRLVAMDATLVNDMGAYIRTHGTLVSRTSAANIVGPYVVPAYRCRVQCVMTTTTPTGTMRAPGHYEATFVRERALDMLAAQIGLSPVELRRRNFVQPEQMPYRPGTDVNGAPLVYDTGDFPAVFARALDGSGYARLARESAEHNATDPDVRLGVGLACLAEPSGLGPVETAHLCVTADGIIEIHTGATSQGQGHETTLAQICASVIDVPLERIVVRHGDTRLTPRGEGTYASRGTVMAGSAVYVGSDKLKTEILRVAADLLEASPEDLRITNGHVTVAGVPSRSLSLADIARRGELAACHEHETKVKTTSFSVHVAQVAVDIRTGTVQPRRYTLVSDIGRVINPLLVEGQLAGGVIHGLGGALREELIYDESGQLLTATLMDYALPAAADCPNVDVVALELSPSPSNPLGVKGAGEAGTAGAGAALANAVAAALSPRVEITELPLTATRLFPLIDKAFA